MDPEVLLTSKGDDAPSGDNLEYDPVFIEMELAAQPGEETQIGDQVTAAEDPDYKEVEAKALEVLEQSHDLRAAVFLADAMTHMHGLTGFAKCAAYIRGCVEQYWDSCHPELDEDDDNDPTMRVNAVQGLSGQPDGLAGASPVYRNLRRAPLTESRGFGRFSVREIEVANGETTAPEDMENIPDQAAVSAAFQDTDADTLTERREAVTSALEDVEAISAVFDEKTPGLGPDLNDLIKLLKTIAGHFKQYAGADDAAGEDTAASGADNAPVASEGGAAPVMASGGPVGGINSPADVSNALDRIMDYYQRREPSSPVPVIIGRAKRLVNADFMTIMQDMAPGGLGSVRMIGGLAGADEDDDY
jgi:type VI secretion system protein ImpA